MDSETSLDYRLVRHSAPTLAGLKAGSLFCVDIADGVEISTKLDAWNNALLPYGIAVTLAGIRLNRGIIYVYRESQLKNLLSLPGVKTFLSDFGYKKFDTKSVLWNLWKRFAEMREFPHEIGIFLGYPLEDVTGFLENGGKNCKACGYWKVYGDACSAKRKFFAYDKCSKIYCDMLRRGYSISRLAVHS